jgi:hypothetical protein
MAELSATKQLQQRFWNGFCRSLGRDADLACAAWDANMGHAMNVSEGKHYELTLRFNVRDRRVEADLTLKGHNAKRNFTLLRNQFHGQADGQLGPGAEWQPEVPNRPNYPRARAPEAHVRLKRTGVDPRDESNWQELWSWLGVKASVLNGWRRALDIT